MIIRSPYLNQHGSQPLNDATDVLVEACKIIVQDIGRLSFGMENDMYVVFDECICHFVFFLLCRPYGANCYCDRSLFTGVPLRFTPAYTLLAPMGLMTILRPCRLVEGSVYCAWRWSSSQCMRSRLMATSPWWMNLSRSFSSLCSNDSALGLSPSRARATAMPVNCLSLWVDAC